MAKSQKAFDWTQFTLKIFIEASPQQVWGAWTKSDQLRNWFPERGELDPRKGGKIVLGFLHPEDTLDAKLISVSKGKRLVFPFGKHGEQVEVKIRKHQSGTICELTQSKMRTTPRDKVSMHMGCRTGWTFFLTNLKSWLEHRVDLRSHNPKMSYRNGFVNS